MRQRLYLIILWAMATVLTVNAQESNVRQIYDQAENDYQIGRIEQAMDLLQDNMTSFSGNLKVSVYRLLSLCNLGLDNFEEAERYANLLLKEDPYYTTSVQDPQRFSEMVATLKSGLSSTITTASSQEENLNEVPVPVTLITAEMIENSGAQNLQEVLAAFVPGMTIVDCNDDINIAMRGIYSNGQEKILFMLNGHRMNSYCTNISSPDYSMNLDKIKQIEVLRGPASSLYGGVALTAVVNLITKQGADIDGVEASVAVGNYGQLRGNFLFGKRYYDIDIMVWGSLYKAKGQSHHVSIMDLIRGNTEGDVIIGGIGDKPSFELGLQLKWGDVRFMYDTHFSQVQSPFSMGYLHTPYNIDAYNTFNGIRPSFATQAHHADLSYQHRFNKLNLTGTFRYDNGDLTHYQVISDSIVPAFTYLLGFNNDNLAFLDTVPGLSRYINGQEQTLQGQLQADLNYINNDSHQGTLSFGAEYIHFKVDDARYLIGYNFTDGLEASVLSEFGKGRENSFNAFLQLKHHWRSFIINAGLRYDHMLDYNDDNIKEFSPRVALIWSKPKWNLKLSYSKSFINAPYLYRKGNEHIGYLKDGAVIPLTKETMHSYQLTFGATNWVKGLNFEFNGFYNKARDLIYQTIIEHMNTGSYDTYGIEFQGSYESDKFSSNLAVCWQDIRTASIFNYEHDRAFNIPNISANLVLGWKVNKRLLFHSHISFEGNKTSYFINTLNEAFKSIIKKEIEEAQEAGNMEDLKTLETALEKLNNIPGIETEDHKPLLLVNLGAQYKLKKFTLGFDVRNLFNTYYERSGMGTEVVPQKGRWFTFKISYKF